MSELARLPDPPAGCRWKITPYASRSLNLKLKRGWWTVDSELILTDRCKTEADFRTQARIEAQAILARYSRANSLLWARRLVAESKKSDAG